jgi:hypothetical protein
MSATFRHQGHFAERGRMVSVIAGRFVTHNILSNDGLGFMEILALEPLRTDGQSRGAPTFARHLSVNARLPNALPRPNPIIPHVNGWTGTAKPMNPKPLSPHPTFFLSSRLVAIAIEKSSLQLQSSLLSVCCYHFSPPYASHFSSSYERHRPPQLRQSSSSTTQHRQSSTPHQLYITSPTLRQILLLLFPPTQHRPHILNNHGASLCRRRLCVACSRRPV